MISNTPFNIVAGELGIAIALAVLARLLRRGGLGTTISTGVAEGLAIFLAYVLGFTLIEGMSR
jgi:hypothetical protein